MNIIVEYNEKKYFSDKFSNYDSSVYGVVYLDYDQVWPTFVIDEESRRRNVSRPTRNNAARYTKGLPATAKFLDDRVVVMTPDIQLWMHELCREQVPSMPADLARNSWKSLMADDRYITNFAGSTTRADYINGTNLDREPMALLPMSTGGAIKKIIGETRIAGQDCWIFEAIDSLGNYRQYHPLTHPWLFYRPTNSVRVELVNSNGVWTGGYRENKSDPLPQYDDKSIIPIFNVGKSENYLPKWRIRILNAGEQWPSPFVP